MLSCGKINSRCYCQKYLFLGISVGWWLVWNLPNYLAPLSFFDLHCDFCVSNSHWQESSETRDSEMFLFLFLFLNQFLTFLVRLHIYHHVSSGLSFPSFSIGILAPGRCGVSMFKKSGVLDLNLLCFGFLKHSSIWFLQTFLEALVSSFYLPTVLIISHIFFYLGPVLAFSIINQFICLLVITMLLSLEASSLWKNWRPLLMIQLGTLSKVC